MPEILSARSEHRRRKAATKKPVRRRAGFFDDSDFPEPIDPDELLIGPGDQESNK